MGRQELLRYESNDYYAWLNLEPGCSADDVKKQFRQLALAWHPDKHPEGPPRDAATDVFQRVNEAHSVLADAETRRRYDVVWRRVHDGAARAAVPEWARSPGPGQCARRAASAERRPSPPRPSQAAAAEPSPAAEPRPGRPRRASADGGGASGRGAESAPRGARDGGGDGAEPPCAGPDAATVEEKETGAPWETAAKSSSWKERGCSMPTFESLSSASLPAWARPGSTPGLRQARSEIVEPSEPWFRDALSAADDFAKGLSELVGLIFKPRRPRREVEQAQPVQAPPYCPRCRNPWPQAAGANFCPSCGLIIS